MKDILVPAAGILGNTYCPQDAVHVTQLVRLRNYGQKLFTLLNSDYTYH